VGYEDAGLASLDEKIDEENETKEKMMMSPPLPQASYSSRICSLCPAPWDTKNSYTKNRKP